MSTVQHFELPQPIYPGNPANPANPGLPLVQPLAPVLPAVAAPGRVPTSTPAPWWRSPAARISAGLLGALLVAGAGQAAFGGSSDGSRRTPGGDGGEVTADVEAATVALVGNGIDAGEAACVSGGLAAEPDLVAALKDGSTLLVAEDAAVAAEIVAGCVSATSIAAAITASPDLAELDADQLACVQEQVVALDQETLAWYLALGLSGSPDLYDASTELFGACSY